MLEEYLNIIWTDFVFRSSLRICRIFVPQAFKSGIIVNCWHGVILLCLGWIDAWFLTLLWQEASSKTYHPAAFVTCDQLLCANFTVNYAVLSTTGLHLRPVSWSQLLFVTVKKCGSATNKDVTLGDILQTFADVGPIYQLEKKNTREKNLPSFLWYSC